MLSILKENKKLKKKLSRVLNFVNLTSKKCVLWVLEFAVKALKNCVLWALNFAIILKLHLKQKCNEKLTNCRQLYNLFSKKRKKSPDFPYIQKEIYISHRRLHFQDG